MPQGNLVHGSLWVYLFARRHAYFENGTGIDNPRSNNTQVIYHLNEYSNDDDRML